MQKQRNWKIDNFCSDYLLGSLCEVRREHWGWTFNAQSDQRRSGSRVAWCQWIWMNIIIWLVRRALMGRRYKRLHCAVGHLVVAITRIWITTQHNGQRSNTTRLLSEAMALLITAACLVINSDASNFWFSLSLSLSKMGRHLSNHSIWKSLRNG